MAQGRWSDLARTLDEYDRSFRALPEHFEDSLCVLQSDHDWAVDVPLWSKEEGRSDLELRLDLNVDERGQWHATVDDLLVP